ERIAVARHGIAIKASAPDDRLGAIERGVHGARRRATLLAENEPGLQRLAQLERYSLPLHRTPDREAELEVGQEPARIERHARARQLVDDALEVRPDEMRQHEAVVQRRAPTHQRA